jgi:iron complex transport system substrate-binding protein
VGDMGMGDIPRETMLGLRPDFVLSTWGGGFASENGFATREELRQAGATTYVPEVTCAGDGAPGHEETVEDSYALLSDLGRIFDVGDHAEELIVRITYAPNPLAGRTAAAISFNTC